VPRSVFDRFRVYSATFVSTMIASFVGAAIAVEVTQVGRAVGDGPQAQRSALTNASNYPRQSNPFTLTEKASDLEAGPIAVEGDILCSSERDCVLFGSRHIEIQPSQESGGVQQVLDQNCSQHPCHVRLVADFSDAPSKPTLYVYQMEIILSEARGPGGVNQAATVHRPRSGAT
jgi:hypothetical protein